jgi:hypothetical protein
MAARNVLFTLIALLAGMPTLMVMELDKEMPVETGGSTGK